MSMATLRSTSRWKSGKSTPSKYNRKVNKNKDTSPYSFRPQLSKKSLQIAEKLGSSRDRLTRPTKVMMNQRKSIDKYRNDPKQMTSQSKTYTSYTENYDTSLDVSSSFFRPAINPKSREIDRQVSKSPLNKSMNRFEKLYYQKDQQMAKITALKSLYTREDNLKEEENCTFRPEVNSYYNRERLGCRTPTNVIERNLQWQ